MGEKHLLLKKPLSLLLHSKDPDGVFHVRPLGLGLGQQVCQVELGVNIGDVDSVGPHQVLEKMVLDVNVLGPAVVSTFLHHLE